MSLCVDSRERREGIHKITVAVYVFELLRIDGRLVRTRGLSVKLISYADAFTVCSSLMTLRFVSRFSFCNLCSLCSLFALSYAFFLPPCVTKRWYRIKVLA